MEPITILPDGSIPEVKMTTQGAGSPIDSGNKLEAFRACSLFGDLNNRLENGEEILTGGTNGDFADYRYLLFNGQTTFHAYVRGRGVMSLHLDQPFRGSAGSIEVISPDAWREVTCSIPAVNGKHSVHLVFHSGDLSVKHFWFS